MPSLQTLKSFSAICLGVLVALFLYIVTAFPSHAYTLEVSQLTHDSTHSAVQELSESQYNLNHDAVVPLKATSNMATKIGMVATNNGSSCTGGTWTMEVQYCTTSASSGCSTPLTYTSTTTSLAAGATEMIYFTHATGARIDRIHRFKINAVSGGTNCGTNLRMRYQSTDPFDGTDVTGTDYWQCVTGNGDCAFELYSGVADPRADPVITVISPEDVSYLSTDVPLRWVTNVCEDDYADEEPLWAAILSKWDGDSFEHYETQSFGDSHNLLVDNDCDTGLAYGFGEISPALFWPAALPDGDYQLAIAVTFDGFSVSDTVTQDFTVGEIETPPAPDIFDDLDVVDILDFPSGSCSFVDDSVPEAIVTVATCIIGTINWIVLGPSDPGAVLTESTGYLVQWFEDNDPQLFMVNYASEPVAAMYEGYSASIGEACDLPTLSFVGNTTDLCDVLAPVRGQAALLNILLNAAFWLAMVSMMIGIFFTAFGQSYDGD